MEGITLILTEPLSEKAKEKLKKLSESQKRRIDQMKKEFEDGKYDDIINSLSREIEYKAKFQKALKDIDGTAIKKDMICEVSRYYTSGNFELVEYHYQHIQENFEPSSEEEFLKQDFVFKKQM